jgi:dienelactone hydrolase
MLPAPTPVNTTPTGAPYTGPNQVVVELDPALPEATIFRPKQLNAAARLPIVVWAQGGCAMNGLANPEFNAEIASHGYLMISDGAPHGNGNRAQVNDYQSMGEPLVKYVDWAIAENARPCSQYYQRLDPTKIAVFGWSCGGLMAEGASSDARITTFMINSSGMINYDQKIVDGMHTPALIVLGGESDIAYPNGMNDYAKITKVPVVVASTDVGHGGTYQADNGGSFAKVDLAWLNWWLKGDEGATGKGMFVGAGCGLCTDAKWKLQSKNFAP